MKKKCILLVTKDKRSFLVKEKDLPNLKEFIKTFEAQIHRVLVNSREKILDIEPLISAICDHEYKESSQKSNSITDKQDRSRADLVKNALTIRSFIKESLNKGECISLKELKEKFKSINVTTACLCNHLTAIRKEMGNKGINVVKIGAGRYKIQ